MRFVVLLSLVLWGLSGFSQKASWQDLNDQLSYQWKSKKAIKGTEYFKAKIKIKNLSDSTLDVKFTLIEYVNGVRVSNSDEESFCIKPGSKKVILVQLVSSSAKTSETSELSIEREFSDLEVKVVEACPAK